MTISGWEKTQGCNFYFIWRKQLDPAEVKDCRRKSAGPISALWRWVSGAVVRQLPWNR